MTFKKIIGATLVAGMMTASVAAQAENVRASTSRLQPRAETTKVERVGARTTKTSKAGEENLLLLGVAGGTFVAGVFVAADVIGEEDTND